MDELLGAEDAMMTACGNLRGYIETAASFDGREVLYDFSTGEPQILAHAATPNPQLIAPTPLPPTPSVGAAAFNAGNATEQSVPEFTSEPYFGSDYGYGADDENAYKPSPFHGLDFRPLVAVGAVFLVIIFIMAVH